MPVSSGASAAAINFALKHFKLELKPGKVQPVASDSSSPAKVRAVLVRSCLLKPPPPPDPCSRPQAHAPHAHTLTLCSASGNGEAPQQDTAPHTCPMNQGTPEAPSMALGDLTSSVPTPRAPATAGSQASPLPGSGDPWPGVCCQCHHALCIPDGHLKHPHLWSRGRPTAQGQSRVFPAQAGLKCPGKSCPRKHHTADRGHPNLWGTGVIPQTP